MQEAVKNGEVFPDATGPPISMVHFWVFVETSNIFMKVVCIAKAVIFCESAPAEDSVGDGGNHCCYHLQH